MQPEQFSVYVLIGFLLGACIGSFADAAASRTVTDRKWWGCERSRCESCGRVLSVFDLIPVFSWLILQERCRTCKVPIPPRHFLTELLAGALSALFVYRFGLTTALLFSFVSLLFLLFHALTDILCGYIYDSWVFAMIACAAVLRIFLGGFDAAADGAIGAVLGFAVIYAIVLLSRGGMGTGDAMLMLGIGAMMGWKMTVLSLYLGFMAGGLVVIPLLLMKKVARKDVIALGPFLAVGAGLSMLFAGPLLRLVGFSLNWPWNI